VCHVLQKSGDAPHWPKIATKANNSGTGSADLITGIARREFRKPEEFIPDECHHYAPFLSVNHSWSPSATQASSRPTVNAEVIHGNCRPG
jgi:hypothetical protein